MRRVRHLAILAAASSLLAWGCMEPKNARHGGEGEGEGPAEGEGEGPAEGEGEGAAEGEGEGEGECVVEGAAEGEGEDDV